MCVDAVQEGGIKMKKLSRLVVLATTLAAVLVLSALPAISKPISEADSAYLNDLVQDGARRVSAREVVLPGPDGRFGPSKSLDAAAAALGETSLTDDIGIVVQASWGDCPAGWACLFDYTNWRGRMVKFQSSIGYWQPLSTWNFANRTSSWRNRRNHCSYLNIYGNSIRKDIMMSRHSSSSTLGKKNNKADAIMNSYDSACRR